jgi:hypothetical protein
LERLFDLQCGDGKPVVPKPNMPCIISTSMGTYCSYFPENVLSTDMATFYWSPRAPVSDDVFIIEFKSSPPMQISRLEIITGHPMGTHDRLESGVVQIRRVTETADWLTLGSFNDGRYYQSWSNMAIPVHSIRIQVTASQKSRLIIHKVLIQ